MNKWKKMKFYFFKLPSHRSMSQIPQENLLKTLRKLLKNNFDKNNFLKTKTMKYFCNISVNYFHIF